MKKAILLATKHPIQRGAEQKDSFESYIVNLCNIYNINAIAEEIDNQCISIAQNISHDRNIIYKIIEPTPMEKKELNIEEIHHIDYEFITRYDIQDSENIKSTLPNEAKEEYYERIQNTYRQREVEWLKRINKLDTWTILIICGADHYESFYELLVSVGIDVIKEQDKFGLL